MKTMEGNATRGERRNAARKAGTLNKWRDRDRYGVNKTLAGKDKNGKDVFHITQVVGPPK